MKRIIFSATLLMSAALPVAAHAMPATAAPVAASAKQAICVPAETTLPDGTVVEGQFCYSSGGRV
jgi:hypothetical protein